MDCWRIAFDALTFYQCVTNPVIDVIGAAAGTGAFALSITIHDDIAIVTATGIATAATVVVGTCAALVYFVDQGGDNPLP
jgi:hypothetical protein